jgi:hypothetical protein
MAELILLEDLTLNAAEAQSLSECVQEQLYSKPELTAVHEVITGVEMDRYIPILGKYGIIGKVDPSSCSTNSETGQIPVSEKSWTPKLISGRLSHCQADLPNLLKFWKKSAQTNPGYWETIDNEMMAFINDRLVDALLESIFRITEFGDTAAEVVGSGGYLTAGTTKTYFNMLNGMWKQIFTDQAGSALSYRYTITENAADNKLEQVTLASDTALKIFRDLYENADSRIFEGNSPVFQVTKSIADNWESYLEDKSIIFTLDRTEKGATKFQYRGIPIIVRNDWTRTIRAYHDLGDTYYLPHRAILTDTANIPIGTSDSESLYKLDSWYERKDKTHYIDFAYKIDQKNLQEELLAVAY